MQSHFKKVYREIRSSLSDPHKALYIIHTSVGEITIKRMRYEEDLSYVFMEGLDENKKYRLFAFSESQLANFVFEVRPKNKRVEISFRASLTDDAP